jgi:hypothetical protein
MVDARRPLGRQQPYDGETAYVINHLHLHFSHLNLPLVDICQIVNDNTNFTNLGADF